MGSYRDLLYEHVDKQFDKMGGAKDYFSDQPLVDPVPYETGLPIQPAGWIGEGAVNDLNLFAQTIRPVAVVASLPVLPDADYPEGSTVVLTTDGKLYRNYGDTWTTAVGAVSGGIEILGALPALPDAAYPPGCVVFLTTDDKLYRNDDDVWSVAVDGGDISADTITGNSIVGGTITGAKIAASTIEGSNIAANTIEAANIAADTITAGEIAAGAISTSELAAGAVTAAKIAARTIEVGLFQDPVGNMVSNPGFEADANGTIDPNITSWRKALGTSANFVVSTTSPHTGDNCLLITASAGAAQNIEQRVGASGSGFIPVEASKVYRFSVWFRGKAGNNAAANINYQVDWFTSGFASISTSAASSSVVGASTTWVKSSNDFTAPATAAFALITIVVPVQTAGDVLGVDDVSSYRMDRDINNADGNVLINDDGITITNGVLTISDQFGNNVLSGAGFGASWTDFISSGFYNNHFQVGTTNSITTATIVNTASTDADYLASLSDDIPYWVVSAESGAGTFKRVSDSTAVGGYAVQWDGTEDATIFQDIPVLPGQSYHVFTSWRYTTPTTAEFSRTFSYQFRKYDHSAIGSQTDSALTFSDELAAYADAEVTALPATAPADARYLRVIIQIAQTAGSPTVWINAVRVEIESNEGTAFPTAARDNRRFFRTDLNMEFFYDATNAIWLSSTLYIMPVGGAFTTLTATGTPQACAIPFAGLTNLWLENFYDSFFVASGGSALSSSNKWVSTLVKNPAASTIATVTVDSGASNAWRASAATAIGALVGTTNFEFQVTSTKTGNPGNYTAMFTLTYRVVAA